MHPSTLFAAFLQASAALAASAVSYTANCPLHFFGSSVYDGISLETTCHMEDGKNYPQMLSVINLEHSLVADGQSIRPVSPPNTGAPISDVCNGCKLLQDGDLICNCTTATTTNPLKATLSQFLTTKNGVICFNGSSFCGTGLSKITDERSAPTEYGIPTSLPET